MQTFLKLSLIVSLALLIACERPNENTVAAEESATAEAAERSADDPDEDASVEPSESESDDPARDDEPREEPSPSGSRHPVLALMDAICDDGEATREGCKRCPGFALVPNEEQRFELEASAAVELSSRSAKQRLVTFTGCSTVHTANGRSTVLVARRDGGWRRLEEFAGMDVDECKLLARGDGRQIAVCVSRTGARDGNMTNIVSITGEPGGRIDTDRLLTIESHPAECQRGEFLLDTLDDLYGEDKDGDGRDELYVRVKRRNGKLPAEFESTCDEGFDPPGEIEVVVFENRDGRLERAR